MASEQSLNLNFGLRYDYPGVLHSANHDLTSFDPTVSTGIAVIGVDRPSLYNKYWRALVRAWVLRGSSSEMARRSFVEAMVSITTPSTLCPSLTCAAP